MKNTIKVIKYNCPEVSKAKYMILKNNLFYTGNISKFLARHYVDLFRNKGFEILN